MTERRKTVSLADALREAYVEKHGAEPTGPQLELLEGIATTEIALRKLGASVPGDEPLAPRGPLQ